MDDFNWHIGERKSATKDFTDPHKKIERIHDGVLTVRANMLKSKSSMVNMPVKKVEW